MAYYVTFGDYQRQIDDYYQKYGYLLSFPDMLRYLYQKEILTRVPSPTLFMDGLCDSTTDEEFDKIVDSFSFIADTGLSTSLYVEEPDLIPRGRDVFIIRQWRCPMVYLHTHNFFEINFVISGQCTLHFENELRTLKAGDLCIIAPNSNHDISINDSKATVLSILIRKTTFYTTFYPFMSQDNSLSYFFRTIRHDIERPNYLLFSTKNSKHLRVLIRNAMIECYKPDSFSNQSCVCWMHLFFIQMLRECSQAIQFYDYQMGAEFAPILQYIRCNYQALTLASLAKTFHYSEPYLSTLIKQNAGCNFTDLVKQMRMANAASYLENTEMRISEIADCIGYNSPDHFSRIFRSFYKMSPQEYRKAHLSEDKD